MLGKYGYPYHFPCYDVLKIAQTLTNRIGGRHLEEIRFYTGVPTLAQTLSRVDYGLDSGGRRYTRWNDRVSECTKGG